MVDSRFFHNAGSVTLHTVASLTNAVITPQGGAAPGAERAFTSVAPLDKAGPSDISFLDNTKYLDAFAQSKAGACFVRAKFAARAPEGMVLLVTEEPYFAYALTARELYAEPAFEPAISKHAFISSKALIGRGVRIDSGAVIEDGATIGDGCWIGSNTMIGQSVVIGKGSRIGALCSITHALIGERAIFHRGVHIGQDGFGFAPGSKGVVKVPQLGRVVIGNDVEIGAGSCIDRGAGPDTTIGDSTKIDNLVQIGHNVQVGKYVFIAAQCGIAGSSQIGDGAQLGGQVGISGHVTVGARARLAAQAGVHADIPAGATYGGSPAVPVMDWHRQTIALAKMTGKMAKSKMEAAS